MLVQSFSLVLLVFSIAKARLGNKFIAPITSSLVNIYGCFNKRHPRSQAGQLQAQS